MLPHANVDDDGYNGTGTIYGGPFTGPDTFEETGTTFLKIDKNVILEDAIASLADGSAPTEQHAYLISINDTQNVKAVLRSTQIPPNSNLRKVPPLHLKAGMTVYVRGVQISNSGAAAEATTLTLAFKSG